MTALLAFPDHGPAAYFRPSIEEPKQAVGPNRAACLVLAAVLLDPETVQEVLPIWGRDPDVARPIRVVWRAALWLAWQERPIDCVTLRQAIGLERLWEVGGLRTLSGLALLVGELPSPLTREQVRTWAREAVAP